MRSRRPLLEDATTRQALVAAEQECRNVLMELARSVKEMAEKFDAALDQLHQLGHSPLTHRGCLGSPEPSKGKFGNSADGARLAVSRGEQTLVAWVQDGTLIEAKALARAWGLTPQAVGAAAKRGEVFAIKVANRLYYASLFQALERATVAKICKELGDLAASEKLIFWMRKHGGLAGKTVSQALSGRTSIARVVEIAAAWACERGCVSTKQTP